MKRDEPIFLPAGQVVLGAGWVDDPDDEFQWYRIHPGPRACGERYHGIEIVLGLDVVYADKDDPRAAVTGYTRPEFYVERDPRDPAVNGGSRSDYGYVPIPVHDAAHALAILATPAAEVVRLLGPALEWARIVPSTVENVDGWPGYAYRFQRLFHPPLRPTEPS